MPHNLLKVYNQLLELGFLTENQRMESLRRIFKRDIEDNEAFSFKGKRVNPTKVDADPMDILFNHLTSKIVDENTRRREYEQQRSMRLHWIRHHVEERKQERVLHFSVNDRYGVRTYIFDVDENYVIILEPYRTGTEYYLISAYYLEGRNALKIQRKYQRRLPDLH